MITLFPFTSWHGSSGNGPTGTNWPFFATADITHPYAAAIMAQEIYESRYKAVRMMGVVAVAMAAYVVAAYVIAPLPFYWQLTPFAFVIGILAVGLLPPWQQTLELRGQMVECIVRRNLYATNFGVATDEAIKQLESYNQFDGWPTTRLRNEFMDEQQTCEAWVNNNRKLIHRIVAEVVAEVLTKRPKP